MAKKRYYLDTRVLTAFFFAAMPFVAFGSFVVVSMARGQLRESVGISLEQRAVQTKLAIEHYVAEQLMHLRLLAIDPQVTRAAAARRAVSADEQRRLEQAWASGTEDAVSAAVLSSPLALSLRQSAAILPMLKLIQVVDGQGRLIAASARGGRLFQAESAWFKSLAAEESPAEAFVGDIQHPAGSRWSLLEIAYPIHDADGGWQGAVRALVDATDIYTVLAPVRVGRTGHAVLFRSTDGMILASDESERILTQTFPGFDSLRRAIEGFPLAEQGEALFGKGQQRGYWTIPEVRGQVEGGQTIVIEPPRLVGYSPVDQVPGLSWMVAVEQDLSEALAPIESVTRYLWIHFIGVFATLILLALYFSFKLEKPVMEESLHLHEEHVPAGGKASDE